MMEQQDAAQHVFAADVADEIGVRFGIADGDPEMMVRVTEIMSDAGAGPGEHEDAGLSIEADLVADQDGPTVWAIHDHSRQQAFGRPTSRDRTAPRRLKICT